MRGRKIEENGRDSGPGLESIFSSGAWQTQTTSDANLELVWSVPLVRFNNLFEHLIFADKSWPAA